MHRVFNQFYFLGKKKEAPESSEEQKATLADFVIEQKITAFTRTYQPCPARLATKTFNDTNLRTFFKAYPCTLGDPLTIYLNRLEEEGFTMEVDMMDEPCIFVCERVTEGGLLELR